MNKVIFSKNDQVEFIDQTVTFERYGTDCSSVYTISIESGGGEVEIKLNVFFSKGEIEMLARKILEDLESEKTA